MADQDLKQSLSIISDQMAVHSPRITSRDRKIGVCVFLIFYQTFSVFLGADPSRLAACSPPPLQTLLLLTSTASHPKRNIPVSELPPKTTKVRVYVPNNPNFPKKSTWYKNKLENATTPCPLPMLPNPMPVPNKMKEKRN